MSDEKEIKNALAAIDPSRLDYSEWTKVGMALKSEGLSVSVWDEWSSRDFDRYHPGECQKKWDTFTSSGVGIGTVFLMAKDYGWRHSEWLDWDSEIGDYEEVIAQHTSTDDSEPYEMAIQYLEALFQPDEYVGWVNQAIYKEDRDKYIPANRGYSIKCSELIRELKKYKNLEDVFGTIDSNAGAWIRINPLDGNGFNDSAVTRWDYALVESDTMSLEDQKKIIISLKLPVVALVESGGKSVHAIVRVSAANEQEYKQRVSKLYDELNKHGMVVDSQNSNPSRLSRLPGAERQGNIQRLLATDMGLSTWEEWIDSLQGIDDNLPEIISAESMFEEPIPEPPRIIDGILRKGAKMILTGDSKSGKTCLMTNLAICIAEGWEWLGFKCSQGRILYINMEVMQYDFQTRYRSVYKAYEKKPTKEGMRNFDYWNLRGKAEPLEKLAPKIVRRCRDKNYQAIIVDPIYKVQGGDENSAEAIGKFCALFDKIAEETGAAMIYVHHHAKGAQGNRKAMDRGSGSGVFSRDADAILDFSGLALDKNELELVAAITGKMLEEAPVPLRLEMELRGFKKPKSVNLFFEFPLHIKDTTHILDDAPIEGSAEANRKLSPTHDKSDSDKMRIVDECFEAVVKPDGTAKFSDMYNSALCEVSKDTLKSYLNKQCSDKYDFNSAKGIVTKK